MYYNKSTGTETDRTPEENMAGTVLRISKVLSVIGKDTVETKLKVN